MVVCSTAFIMAILQFRFARYYARVLEKEIVVNRKSMLSNEPGKNMYHDFILEVDHLRKTYFTNSKKNKLAQQKSRMKSKRVQTRELTLGDLPIDPPVWRRPQETIKVDSLTIDKTKAKLPKISSNHIVLIHLYILLMIFISLAATLTPYYIQIWDVPLIVTFILDALAISLIYGIGFTIARLLAYAFTFQGSLLLRIKIFSIIICAYKTVFFVKEITNQSGFESLITLIVTKIVWKLILYLVHFFLWFHVSIKKKEVIHRMTTLTEETKIQRNIEVALPRRLVNFVIRFFVWQLLDLSSSVAMIIIALGSKAITVSSYIHLLDEDTIDNGVVALTFDLTLEFIMTILFSMLMKLRTSSFKHIRIILNACLYIQNHALVLISILAYSIFIPFYYQEIWMLRDKN